MRHITSLAGVAVVVFMAACGDTRPTSPSDTELNAAVSDGSRTGGNPDFFFLPSLAPDPRRLPNFDPGGFNGNLAPVVKVCLHPNTAPADLRNFDCNPAVAPIATISGTNVRVFPALQFYLAVWKTRDYNLDPHRVYRIQVFLGSKRLGFADVTVVTSLREARNAITGDIVPLGADWTLPIPFRIENGALGACKPGRPDCTEVSVRKEGGTFFTNTKFAGVQLQPGWASDAAFAAGGGTIQLTIERLQEQDGNCHAIEGVSRRLFDELTGCYHYKTDPDIRPYGGFQGTGHKVGQCSGKARTDANKGEDYQLFKSDGAAITALKDVAEPLGLNCTAFAFIEGLPTNPALRFASMKWHSVKGVVSRLVGVNVAYAWDGGLGGLLEPADGFSHISRGRGLNKTAVVGDDQSAAVGYPVPNNPKVRITSTHVHVEELPHGVAAVPVTFTAAGGGNVGGEGAVSRTVETDAEGYASVPWYLGAGPNTLAITAPTIDPTPITFTATVIRVGSITGTVKDGSGAALSGAPVRLVSTGEDAFTPRSTTTDEAGAYSFTDLPAGSYNVSAAAIGFNIAQQFVPLDAGQNQIVNLVLQPLLPDLAVTQFTFAPATPTTADRVVYTIVVSNVGAADAPASEGTLTEGYSRTVNGFPEVGQEVMPGLAVPAVPAAGSITLTLTRGPFFVASWGATFTVNTGFLAVPESNGANNRGSVSFPVTAAVSP